MYVEGGSVSAIARVMDIKLGTVHSWVKKVCWAKELVAKLCQGRAARGSGQPQAKVISWDEMWTYVGSRRRGMRRERWIWTAVVE